MLSLKNRQFATKLEEIINIMNRKISVGAAISLAIMFAAVTFIMTMIYSAGIFEDKVTDINEREAIYSKLNEVDMYVRENYFGDIDEEYLSDNIIEGYVEGLNDKYGIYLTAEDYAKITSDFSGSLVGIGAVFTRDVDGYIKIQEIYEDSPASVAELQVGDVIVKVDDLSVTSENYEEAVSAINGEPGTVVTLRVRSDAVENDVELTRRSIEIPTVALNTIGEIAVIRIKEFNDNTPHQFDRILRQAMEAEAQGIIFDVRSNPGGTIDSVTEILDILLPAGPIVSANYWDGTTEILAESDASSIEMPMVVVINEKTASAAELFAQALKDYEKANIVGMQSYGKGSIQNIKKLSDGSALDLTIAHFLPPYSENFEGVGVKPDFEVKMSQELMNMLPNLDYNSDDQISKALELLGVQIKDTLFPDGSSTEPPLPELDGINSEESSNSSEIAEDEQANETNEASKEE